MQAKDLQLKRALRTALLVLLLSVVGMGKMYADFYNVTIGDLKYDLYDGTLSAKIVGHKDGTNATGNLIIPSSVTYRLFDHYDQNGNPVYVARTYTVTEIGGSAFSGCSGFTGSLVIPNSVTTIGSYAFYGCSSFTGSLTIPNSVTTIGDLAFFGCSSFTGSLTIPNSVTTLGSGTFYDCSGFTGSLIIPNSVTTIGGGAFSGCSGFTGSLTIPNSVTEIDNYAFYGCSGFTGSLTIPNSVVTIGFNAFYDCSFNGLYIDMINIPSNIGSLFWHYGFISEIGGEFTGNLTIGNSVITIGERAFHSCGFTGSLTIGNSVTTIGTYAFEYCSGFTGSLTIGNSVTSIGQDAFENCSGFTEVHYLGDVAEWCNISFSSPTSNPLWYAHNLYINNSLVTNLDIPETVTEIKDFAFCGCSGSTGNLTIPNSVTTIGGGAFSGCSGFTGDLAIPNSVTTIGNCAFCGCSGFTGSLIIPNSVTTIDEGAFTGCSGFSEVYFNVTNCNSGFYWSFDGCGGVLTIGDDVERIPNHMFQSAAFTGSLTIPNSVTYIGSCAFSSCSGLTGSLTIPNSVTEIDAHAFSFCNGFTGCLTLGYSLTEIEYCAFSGCSGFDSIISLAEAPPILETDVFYGVNHNISVTVPCGSVSAYQNASGWNDFTNIQEDCSFEVTATANPEVGGTVTGAGIYEYGETAILTATPNEGYSFVNWTVDDMEVSEDSLYSFIVTEDRDLVANFLNDSSYYTVTATASPTNGGTVSGAGTFAYSEICTLVAMPNPGYCFLNWMLPTGELISTDTIFSFSVIEDTDLVANFIVESSVCYVTFNLYDSNGDGWNGNYLVVTDGNGFSQALTIGSGSAATYTLPFLLGSHLVLTWIMGSYIEECSFSMSYEDGTMIYQASNISNGFFYEFDVNCSGAAPNYYDITATANPTNGGTVTGAGTYIEGAICTLTATPNEGYIFTNWTKEGTVISTNVDYGFMVVENSIFVANFIEYDPSNAITQTIELSEGWNWFSTSVEITLDDLKAALVEALPTSTTITIKSQNGNTTYNGTVWRGQLTSLDKTRMYMIHANTSCEITLQGMPINPTMYPVTIQNGFNWIAFPLSENMSISNVFDGFAVIGDAIKSQNGNAIYTNEGWRGNLNILEIGKGYMYKSNTQEPRTFTFPVSTK